MIKKPHIKRGIMNEKLGTLNERQQVFTNITEFMFIL